MSPRPQLLPTVLSTTTTTTDPLPTSTTSTSAATSTSTTPTPTSTSTTPTTSTTSTTSTIPTTSTTSTTATTSNTSTSTTPTTTSTTSTTSLTTSSSLTTSVSLTPTQSTTSAILITSSDGSVETSTTVVVITPTVSSSASDTSKSGTSKGFFQNTGAVAGVFTVVGLVALILFVALVTNAVRRRRAKKLDREIAEAAAEAAGTAPAFTDDDYYPDDRLPKGGPSGDVRSMTTGYSDTTHGTFAQPPMSHGGESYNMAELSPYEYGAAAGAAGIGAMGVNRARSMGSNNQTTPYNAFAAPQPAMPNPYEDPASAYGQQQNFHYHQNGPGGAPEMDLLDAAGLGAAGGAAAGYAAAHQAYGQAPNGGNLNRNPSLGPSAATSPSDYSSYGHPSMPQGYQQDYNAYQPNQPAQYNAYQQGPPQGYTPHPGYSAVPPQQQVQQPAQETAPPRPHSTVSAADPYGGYVDELSDAGGSLPGYSSPPPQAGAPPPGKLLSGNFASPPASSEGHDHEDNRMSYQDGDDYGYEPRRVLKVANE